jgi:diguanylate cyclase (GGDEF)-like protein
MARILLDSGDDEAQRKAVKPSYPAISRWHLLLALLALLLLAATGALAGPVPITVQRLDRDVPAADAARVVAGDYASEFVAQPYAAITPSRDHAVWYCLHLAGAWTRPWPPVLSISDPQGLTVDVQVPPERAASYSIYDRRANSGFTRHALVVPLPAALKAATPIYLRVGAERAIPRRLEITGIPEARATDLVHARLDVLFPSIQLATVLVMLSFFVALRERMYGYFVGHVLFLVLYELYAFGIGYELMPFALLAPLGARPAWLTAAVAALLLLEFSSQFLELARVAPRLDRVFAWLRWPLGVLACCAAVPALSPGWWVEDALALILLMLSPLLIVAGMLAWQHGGRRGGFYLCAWIPGLLFVIVRVLQLILHWPLPNWLEFALPAAFAFSSVVLSFGLADHTLSIRHERDVAHRLAEHDVLTGVLNRRAILAHLRNAFRHARDSDEPLSVLFLDLDHFKRVNDGYGHRAGDTCLRAVIAPISSELRQGDALGRYGGEEFLIVLPGAAAANAEVVAERIRRRIEEMPLLVSGTRIDLTLSIGVAAADADVETPEDLIECADAALYRSKAEGRNRVSTHPTSEALAFPSGA